MVEEHTYMDFCRHLTAWQRGKQVNKVNKLILRPRYTWCTVCWWTHLHLETGLLINKTWYWHLSWAYIYIYIYRERERERVQHAKVPFEIFF